MKNPAPQLEAISVWLEIDEITFLIDLLGVTTNIWKSEEVSAPLIIRVGLREAQRRAHKLQNRLQGRLNAYEESLKE